MIIVYAAVAGQSVVKLYAAAMFPGFFLAFLYLVYIVGWAMLNPKIAPALPAEQTQVPIPAWLRQFQSAYSPNMLVGSVRALFSPERARGAADRGRADRTTGRLLTSTSSPALVPLAADRGTLRPLVWWYVVIHSQAAASEEAVPAGLEQLGSPAERRRRPSRLRSGTRRTQRSGRRLRL